MTYTRPWRVVVSRNTPRNKLDDIQRELRVDIEERMQDWLAPLGDWTDDPVAADDLPFAMFLHWSDFKVNLALFGSRTTDFASALSTKYGLKSAVAALTMRAQIKLPVGSTLVDVDLSCHTDASCSFVATVYKVDFSTGTVTRTSLATRTISASTAQGNFSISSGSNINEVIAANHMYYVELVENVSGVIDTGFQGVRVTYTRGIFQHG